MVNGIVCNISLGKTVHLALLLSGVLMGIHLINVFFQSVKQAYSEKEILSSHTGVKPMTFRLLVWMLYH